MSVHIPKLQIVPIDPMDPYMGSVMDFVRDLCHLEELEVLVVRTPKVRMNNCKNPIMGNAGVAKAVVVVTNAIRIGNGATCCDCVVGIDC